ncbi:hypothetical protein Cgig2_026088 [Carnegiea gigantea]|uniref:Uncharacterized protein n=1 Tax=Carnegiea gigantea TaxID=171969 RepID=A0A9Q1KN27_9CARY|nr:hypothetical protein Cgig2_026088 [Carnegiea gigantea]
MSVSFKYWNDCAEPLDIEALWMDPQVKTEWLDAGEVKGQKVHLSRDPDGQPYLTQTEMRAAAEIVSRRHFHSKVDLDMICAIAELESDRILLATRYTKKMKEITYEEGEENVLFRPFLNVYFGIAYLRYLSNFENRKFAGECPTTDQNSEDITPPSSEVSSSGYPFKKLKIGTEIGTSGCGSDFRVLATLNVQNL